ncbi:MAG: SDR family NAD(P)-dependent oxidoreductase [Deltaproteobacteria bacterium]|nr:SDR family NAD(P)-dependent oxidoreductase [Deltaproteobacteria bacterium]
MKALVTGGHGFIGSFLVERLLKEGVQVRCLVRKTSDLRWIRHLNVELVIGDLTEAETLPEAVKGVDVVYHNAGAIKAKTKDAFFSINTHGTVDLAKAVSLHAPNVQRFVYISSVAAVGPGSGDRQATENTPCFPISAYGQSKRSAEEILEKEFSHLPYTIIRPSIVYGPRDEHFLTFFKFARFGWFPIPYPYERYYSIVHVLDLVEGIVLAAASPSAVKQTYILCNEEFYTFENLAQCLTKPFGKNPHFIRIPKIALEAVALFGDAYSWLTKRDMMISRLKLPELSATSWVFSPKKAQAQLSFQPKIPLVQGAHETVAWYRKNNYL